MKKYLLSLIPIVILLSFLFLKASSKPLDYKESLIIKNNVIKSIPNEYNFVGLNWFDYYAQNRLFLKNEKQLNEFGQTLNKFNIDIVRYPGGINVLAYFWDIPNDKKLRALRKLPKFEQSYITADYVSPDDELNFPSFMEFCKKHNIKSTVQVNVHSYYDKDKNTVILLKLPKYDAYGKRIKNSGTVNRVLVEKAAKNAAEQVKWVKNHGGSGLVKYWEMGNEDYGYEMFLNSGYTGEEYAKVCSVFMKEMLKVDPNIKFILTSATYPAGYSEMNFWVADFLNKWTGKVFYSEELKPYRKNIYSFSRHAYETTGIEKRTNYDEFVRKNLNSEMSKRDEIFNNHKKLMNAAGLTKQTIFVNEFNVNNFQNKYMHTWLSTLNLAKLIVLTANNRYVEHMDYHNALHQWGNISCGFGLFNYAKDFEGMKFLPYPAASVVSFINQNFKGEVLESSSNIKNLEITASKNNNQLNIIVVNRGELKEVSIKLEGFDDYKYKSNSVLGSGLPYSFEAFEAGSERENPSEVRMINAVSCDLKVVKDNGVLRFQLPEHSIISVRLEK